MHENHYTHLPKLHNQRVPTPVNQPGFFYSTVCMQTCTYMYTCVLYTNIRACENMNKIKKFFGKTKATKLHDWTQLNTQYMLFFLPHKETFIWDFWLLWNFIRPRGEGRGLCLHGPKARLWNIHSFTRPVLPRPIHRAHFLIIVTKWPKKKGRTLIFLHNNY